MFSYFKTKNGKIIGVAIVILIAYALYRSQKA